MKSIFSIFGAKACFSLCGLGGLLSAAEVNYSLWPKRPEQLVHARELVKQNRLQEATALLQEYLHDKRIAGKEARYIVSQINIREYLSRDNPAVVPYTVRGGDSYFKIAQKTKTSIDMLLYLNGTIDLNKLQAGQKLLLRPMQLTMEINLPMKEILVWDGGKLVSSYPLLAVRDGGTGNVETSVLSKSASLDGASVSHQSQTYAAANKTLNLKAGTLIVGNTRDSRPDEKGYFLSVEDCNELGLLMAPGNTVSIIRSTER